MSTNTPSTRPFNLPPELPDPPAPPAGYRGVYRGMGWRSGKYAKFAYLRQSNGNWHFLDGGTSGSDSLHYIEYIPLRPVPEGVAPVPEGFEYVGIGGSLLNTVGLTSDPNIAYFGERMKWVVGALGMGKKCHYALRIGSEIHHRHFDAPTPVTEPEFRYFMSKDGMRWKAPTNGTAAFVKMVVDWECGFSTIHDLQESGHIETDADGNPLETSVGIPINPEQAKRCNFYDPNPFDEVAPEQPAKAREWEIFKHDHYGIAVKGLIPADGETVFVREIRADEAGFLEEVIRQRDEAVGHLRALVYDDASMFDADEWLSKNFPAPAPEPAFDEDAFWAMMPPWITCRAMDMNGDWNGFESEPSCWQLKFWAAKSENAIRMKIPPEFAPPPAADWKQSLVKRPTPTPAQP